MPVPAIGRYPIQKAIDNDWPESKEANWYRLAIFISIRNPEAFYRINALCNKKLEMNAAGPVQYVGTYIQAPQLATAATHTPCGAASSSGSQAPPPPPPPPPKRAPPPPPNYPPPLRHCLELRGGTRGFEPDAIMELKFGENVSFDGERIEEC